MFKSAFLALLLMEIFGVEGRMLYERKVDVPTRLDVPAKQGALIATTPRETGNDLWVVDYDKSMVGVYLTEDDKCFLVGGVDSSVDFLEQASLPNEEKLHYKVGPDYPVTDTSILPTALQAKCAGKQVQWLERDPGYVPRKKRDADGKVSSSAICVCLIICIGWC